MSQAVAKTGGYTYEDGSTYVGGWNEKGEKQGFGHLRLSDSTRYVGCFDNGLCSGLGVTIFPDGARYEGEFTQGWFHGRGVFSRADGMKYEGEFRGGRLWGWGELKLNPISLISRPVTQHQQKRKTATGRVLHSPNIRLVTFQDFTHGFPRQEGFFQDCRLIKNKRCDEIVERAQKVALLARAQAEKC